MTAATRNDLLARIMDAQSLNARQRRHLFDGDPDINSALEHLSKAFQLAPTNPAATRTHIRDAARLILDALKDNDSERAEQRHAAALVENPGEGGWSKRKVVEKTTGHLDVLVNPIRKSEHAAARAAVLNVIRDAGPELTGSHERPDLRNVGHQLGQAKRTVLWNLVAEAKAVTR